MASSEHLAVWFRKMPLSSVVRVLATRLQVEIVQAPVLQLLAIVLDTDLPTEFSEKLWCHSLSVTEQYLWSVMCI